VNNPLPSNYYTPRTGSVAATEGAGHDQAVNPRVSIDELTVVGYPSDELLQLMESASQLRRYERNGDALTDSFGIHGFGHFKQTTARRYPKDSMSFRFNPSSVSRAAIRELFTNFFEADHVARIDIALDYPLDMSMFLFEFPRAKQARYLSARGALETVYFGSRASKRHLRIYDRQVKNGLDQPEWRVEVEHKCGNGTALPESLLDGLVITQAPPPEALHAETHALIAMAQQRPEMLGRLPSRTRQRVKKRLSQHCLPLSPSPREVYLANLPELCTDLDSMIGGNTHSLGASRLSQNSGASHA